MAPEGDSDNVGVVASAPLTLEEASARAMPGDTVCILPGTYSRTEPFYPARSGTADAMIVYRGEGGEARLVWDGPPRGEADDANLIHFFEGTNYIEVRGLTLDGRDRTDANVKCAESHHLNIVGNRIIGGGTAGIASKFCDYIAAVGNQVYHSGYFGGWSSGISLNSHQWSDDYPGIHSYVIGNVISGSYDSSTNHTDGNGIILDLSNNTYDPASADTPPALVANNVVFQNGGRCIVLYIVSNGWVINNTCYRNGLDRQVGNPLELLANKSRNSWWLNNLAVGWNDTGACLETVDGEGMAYGRNWSFNCDDRIRIDVVIDDRPVAQGDPLLNDPPGVHPSDDQQWSRAVTPWDLGERALEPADDSPLIDAGLDPAQLEGLPPELLEDLIRLLGTDAAGRPRIQGTAIDIGAYEIR
ncbi:MAG: hypothetical protein OEO23_15245 [Gemmatimonadota bacterium]|nr:hypothetical protein [Gemmatimonadota bacterium]